MAFHREETADGVAELVEVVLWTEPPLPNSRMATVVSAEVVERAAAAQRPRDRMDFMVIVLVFSAASSQCVVVTCL